MNQPRKKTNLRQRLSDIQYRVTQNCETEKPFSGEYNYCYEDGVYRCVCCGIKLFDSKTKFDSGSGWPAFFKPASDDCITTREDNTLGMTRTEIMCAKCDAHLGHMFPDGPQPTGVRYCVNSASLDLDSR
tara:strand:- start:145 stop:534 length:390 start_codon:yes stop_codon:yes gene_type:complete